MEEKFNYKYTALSDSEKKEVESIKQQYLPNDGQSKIEQLRKLNKKVNDTASVAALCVGIIACLIFGVGMTMILEWNIFVWGVIVGVIGFISMLFAYPVYNVVLKRSKQKYAERIIKLSEELLNEN